MRVALLRQSSSPATLPYMLSVLIPVYNEEQLLQTSSERVHMFLAERGVEHEIIIVSNGSTDRTVELGELAAAQHDWLRFFSIPEKGPGRAFKVGVRAAKGEVIATLDIDLSSDLNFLNYSLDLMRYADMVVGSKTMGDQRRSLVRVLGSQSYILFTQLLFDLTISDYSIGCKAVKRSIVLPLLETLDDWTGYMFELSLHHRVQGLKLIQVGIDCDDRRASRFNIWHEALYRYRHLYRCWQRLRKTGR